MQKDSKTDSMAAKGRFDLRKWQAPVITDPEELRYILSRMSLESKVIQGFRLTDYSDVMLPEWDEAGTDKEAEEDVQIPAFALLTSPLVIDFTDGTQLEIFMQSQSIVRLSVNRIPPEDFGEERSTLDRLFARCIGTSIVFAEVQVTEDYPEMAADFFSQPNEQIREQVKEQLKVQSDYIDSILLCLDNGDALEIYSWGDSGEMDLLDESGEMATVSMKELMEWA